MDMDVVEASNELERHCVSYRCRLCRFPIRVGETVAADAGYGKLTPSFPFKHTVHVEKDLNMALQGCQPNCPHEDDDQLPAYHVECLRHAPPLTKEGLRATEYVYEPTPFEDPRRAARIRDIAGRRLQMACPILPAEVCLFITEELVRECAAITTHQMLQGSSLQALDSELDASMPVWARYTSIDGIRYVESLSNMGDSQSVLLLDAERASTAEILYVLEDHLGIRQVVFVSYEHSLKLSAHLSKPKNDAWWQTIPIAGEKLIVKSDGFKLRFIIAPSTNRFPDFPRTILWRKPMAPYQAFLNTVWSKYMVDDTIEDPARTHFQNVSVDFNDPAITGYSICWAGGIMGIYSHHAREKFTAYDGFDSFYPTPTWIYIPMDPGERITGIWTRPGYYPSTTGMAFQTNQERLVVVGHCKTSESERLDLPPHWHDMLPNVNRQRFRLHYQLSFRGVENLVAQQLTGLGLIHTSMHMPPCPSVRYRPFEFCHYSSVSLENVVEIIPCRRKVCPIDTPYWAMTGILVRYEDGSQDCAGDFRLDCAEEPINFHGETFINVGYIDKTDSMYWHVVMLLPHGEDNDLAWWGVPMQGELQWWTGDGGRYMLSWLDNMGESSPCSYEI